MLVCAYIWIRVYLYARAAIIGGGALSFLMISGVDLSALVVVGGRCHQGEDSEAITNSVFFFFL